MWSECVGDTFRVFVGHCGADPEGILFVTDANGLFGLAVDTVQIRTRDLTPTPSRHFEGSGHAADFIEFVDSELRPWLIDRHPAAADQMTYFGHSLGGLFGVYSLLTATSTFDRYIVSSPSLWWDDETIFDIGRARADSARLHSEVYFGIGLLETDAGTCADSLRSLHRDKTTLFVSMASRSPTNSTQRSPASSCPGR